MHFAWIKVISYYVEMAAIQRPKAAFQPGKAAF